MAPKKEEDDDDVSSVEIDDDEAEGEEEDEVALNDLGNADVVTKYRTAGDIANKVLAAVLEAVKPGKTALEICALGDAAIEEATSKIYNTKKGGKKVEKGIAFPTCISVNHIVGHYSPLTTENKVVLAEGDLVKVDLGVHVDGYVAVVAHTIACAEAAEPAPVTGRAADVLLAAWTASELAQRMLKEGTPNSEVTKMFEAVAEAYDIKQVEGVLSHAMKRHVIDDEKTILCKTNKEDNQEVDKHTIEKNDVWSIDVLFSTGSGTPQMSEERTTVFKRKVEQKYSLKMKASRQFFSEVNSRFPTMPFCLRAGDERAWRMGVVECVKHNLFVEYPVLVEKPKDCIAHFKFTAMLLPSGKTVRITSPPVPKPNAVSDKGLKDEKLLELLAQEIEVGKKKSKPKKKKKAGEGGGEVEVS